MIWLAFTAFAIIALTENERVAIIGVTGAIIVGAIGAITSAANARRTKRLEDVPAQLVRLEKVTDTGNDQRLGAYVHDVAQTVEHLSAQNHTNTREVLDLAERVVRIEETLEQLTKETRSMDRRILRRLDALKEGSS